MLKQLARACIVSYMIGYMAGLVFCFSPALAQFSPPAGGGGTFTGPFPGNPIDPTILYGAGNNIGGTATTANTTSGSNSIVVASASNWIVGRGIAVTNVPTGGTYVQNGCIGSIAGTTFTIVVCGTSTPVNAPSSQTGMTVITDDTYPLQLAINLAGSTGRPIQLQGIVFNNTSTLVIDNAITLRGAGKGDGAVSGLGTEIAYYGLTGDIILVKKGATLSDFWLIGGSYTSDYGINVTPVPVGLCSNVKPNIQRVAMYFTHAGLRVGIGVEAGVFRDILVQSPVAEGVYYASQTPCGDNLMDNIVSDGDLILYATDTTMFNNFKILPNKITFVHESFRARFNNLSIEGISGCAIDFGSAYISGVTFNGGEIAVYTNAFCNTQQALSSGVSDMIGYNNGTSCTGGLCSGGTGILNYIWPPPIFSGCGTNGAVQGSSDLLNGVVAMTCVAATMTITYNAGPNSVPNNGLLCEVQDLTDPTKLIRQTGYSITNNGTMTSAAYATFALVTTLGSDTLKYHCQGF